MNHLKVSTIAQVATKGFEPVTIGTRATVDKETGKKREIPADQRTRSVLIPELEVHGVPSKFQSIVLDALRNIAKQQLAALWDADKMLHEVPANIWSVDALLMYAARESESKRLSKDSIAAWFATSDLRARIMEKHNEALYKKWEARMLHCSAPSLQFNIEECEVVIKTINNSEDDAESIIGVQIIAKCEKRIEMLRKQSEEIGEVEEI